MLVISCAADTGQVRQPGRNIVAATISRYFPAQHCNIAYACYSTVNSVLEKWARVRQCGAAAAGRPGVYSDPVAG